MRAFVVIAVIAVLIVAGGGGYYALEIYPQQQFRAALDRSLMSLPPGMTGHYKDAHYDVGHHRAVVTGLTLHGEAPGDPWSPFDISAETVVTTNPNLDYAASWARAQSKPADATQDTVLQIADNFEIDGMAIHSPMVTATVPSLSLANPRVFPWALLHDGVPAWQEVRALVGRPMQPDNIEALQPLIRFEAAAALGFGYDAYKVGAGSSRSRPPASTWTMMSGAPRPTATIAAF